MKTSTTSLKWHRWQWHCFTCPSHRTECVSAVVLSSIGHSESLLVVRPVLAGFECAPRQGVTHPNNISYKPKLIKTEIDRMRVSSKTISSNPDPIQLRTHPMPNSSNPDLIQSRSHPITIAHKTTHIFSESTSSLS